jgi:glucosamine 6-phosphate synthetase-like amidotransferase/phosphosugar isomerase protein
MANSSQALSGCQQPHGWPSKSTKRRSTRLRTLARGSACLVLARGFNYTTAFELALKFKELAYVFAEPYSAADACMAR